jgi:hypothetical protein
MPSGLVILAAYNREDQILIGNPEISHFRSIYYHHTPFSSEWRYVNFKNRVAFGQTALTLDFPIDADLIKQVYLHMKLPDIPGYSYTNSIGHALIREVRLRAGETLIDRQSGEFMELWSNLSTSILKRGGLNDLIGRNDAFSYEIDFSGNLDLFVPLQFWFCRHKETAFPLLCLQNQTLQLELDIRPLEEVVLPNVSDCGRILGDYPLEIKALIDYVYLDMPERRWFVNHPQAYLIEQIQDTQLHEFSSGSNLYRMELPFNGLLKEMIFTTRYKQRGRQNLWFMYSRRDPTFVFEEGESIYLDGTGVSGQHGDIIETAKIQYDTYDIVPELPSRFYRVLQPYEHHTAVPDDFVYVYSWAMRPEEWQPTGHLNTFRSHNFTLVLTRNILAVPYVVNIRAYALVYNVMRICDGVLGLDFQYA